MLGKPLITPQTGPKGRLVRRVYVVKDATIARELYLSLLVDRGSGRVAFVASTEGGVDIEAVATNTPEKIVRLAIDPASGISDFHGRVIASALKLEGPLAKQCAALVRSLYTLFVEKDASLIEINPLIVSKDGNLLCLDAKIGFDDNALFRHKDIASLRDIHEEDPAEVRGCRSGALLREARRLRRLSGERRRSRHVDHGHHQALWRRASQFPRCGRRREQGACGRGFQDHPVGPAC